MLEQATRHPACAHRPRFRSHPAEDQAAALPAGDVPRGREGALPHVDRQLMGADEAVREVLERARHGADRDPQPARDLEDAHRHPVRGTAGDLRGGAGIGHEQARRAVRRVRIGGLHPTSSQRRPAEVQHCLHIRRVIGDVHRGCGQGRRRSGERGVGRERQRCAGDDQTGEKRTAPPAAAPQLQRGQFPARRRCDDEPASRTSHQIVRLQRQCLPPSFETYAPGPGRFVNATSSPPL